jgi:hypothetical protein
VKCASPKDCRTAKLSVPFNQIHFVGFTTRLFSTTLTACRCTALATAATYFQSDYSNKKPLLATYLRLKALEHRTGELFNPTALEARQMSVIDSGLCFVEVLLTVQMHQVEFINQSQPFEKFEGSVHCCTIDLAITLLGQHQQGGRIQMAVGVLDGFEQYFSLAGDADAP